jgi:hypothetical protein
MKSACVLLISAAIATSAIVSDAVGQTVKDGLRSGDPGPARELQPVIVGKSRGGISPRAIPPGDEAKIIAASKTGDVYSVSTKRQPFNGQVLKAISAVNDAQSALLASLKRMELLAE